MYLHMSVEERRTTLTFPTSPTGPSKPSSNHYHYLLAFFFRGRYGENILQRMYEFLCEHVCFVLLVCLLVCLSIFLLQDG